MSRLTFSSQVMHCATIGTFCSLATLLSSFVTPALGANRGLATGGYRRSNSCAKYTCSLKCRTQRIRLQRTAALACYCEGGCFLESVFSCSHARRDKPIDCCPQINKTRKSIVSVLRPVFFNFLPHRTKALYGYTPNIPQVQKISCQVGEARAKARGCHCGREVMARCCNKTAPPSSTSSRL